jgi:hypothetical protein
VQNREKLEHHGTHKAGKESLDRAALYVTIASTLIAVFAATAAFWSGWEAHKARVDDERPFVAVDLQPWPGELSVPIEDRAYASAPHLVAFGKSPARHLSVTCGMVSYNPTARITWNPNDKGLRTSTYSDLLPSRTIPIRCGSLNSHATDDSQDSHIVIAIGSLVYADDKQAQYVTPFCYQVTPREKIASLITPCEELYGLPDLKLSVNMATGIEEVRSPHPWPRFWHVKRASRDAR